MRLTGVGEKVRARAGGAHPVILFPVVQADRRELASVMLESAVPTRRWLNLEALYACGLERSVPAVHIAPDEARLIVDTQIGKDWVMVWRSADYPLTPMRSN